MNFPKRTAGRGLATLLSLPFALGGLGLLFFLVIPTVHDWARMTRWVPVQAELVEARLTMTRGSSGTFLPVARYRYRFEGVDHESRRVAIGARADNIGDFQRDLGRVLERSLAAGRPVTAWVNPAAPHEAVLDRSLRVPLLLFQLLFVLLFGGFGLGLLWFIWRKPRPMPMASGAEAKPWLARRDWAENRIRSSKRVELYVLWGMCIFVNLLSAPLLFLHGPKLLHRPQAGALIAMLFPLIGAGLLVWALRSTLAWRREGDLRLQLDPFPGAIGGHVGGSLSLRRPYAAQHRYKVVLSCIHHHYTRSSPDSGWKERLRWQADGLAQVVPASGGSRLSFRFDVPAGLPASSEQKEGDSYHGWRVELRNEPGTPQFERRFQIPVYATGERAARILQDSENAPGLQAQRRAAVEALAHIVRSGERLELYFAPARNARLALGWLGFGLVFGGSGAGVATLGAPLIFPVVFGLMGAMLAAFGIWGLGNSLRVWMDRSSLRTERRFLGIPVRRRSASRREVRHLELDVSYLTQQGARHETIYRVRARLHKGGHIVLADTLRGQSLAEAMLERIARESGLPRAEG